MHCLLTCHHRWLHALFSRHHLPGDHQMPPVERSKLKNCPNECVLFCKGRWLQKNPDSRSKLTRERLSRKIDKEHLKGYKKPRSAPLPDVPQQLAQEKGDVIVTNKGTIQCRLPLNYTTILHPQTSTQGSKKVISGLGAITLSTFYFSSASPTLA